jgi:3-oxoadipate enol-lactonase
VLVGCSDGARRALAFAHRHPERVERVIAVGGAFGGFPDPSPAESAAWQTMLDHFAGLETARAAGGMTAGTAADIDAWGAALGPDARRKMVALQLANAYWIELPESLGTELDPPVKHRFAEITTPITVVSGGQDFEGTRLWAKRILAQAPDATPVDLPDADHFPMLSTPQAFEDVVRAALRLPSAV